jgi:hypothetical protein
MATTYTLINSTTVGSGGAASIIFSSIPATYTDLVVKLSVRSDTTGYTTYILQLNGNNPSQIALVGTGAGVSSNTSNYQFANAGGQTANTFTNTEFYISNYTSSNSKSVSTDEIVENNATAARDELYAGLYSSVTSAVTSITITDMYGSWVQYSTAYLYGISNS